MQIYLILNSLGRTVTNGVQTENGQFLSQIKGFLLIEKYAEKH